MERLADLLELVPILLAGAGVDPTHVSIDTTARLLGVSVPTIRRKIRLGQLPLEVVPGTKVSGIPITAVYEQWIPIRVARAALARERAAMATAKDAGWRIGRGVRG